MKNDNKLYSMHGMAADIATFAPLSVIPKGLIKGGLLEEGE
ncbi:hypothetical protein [uncultured Microbulbifer sp.]|nr:hypothetical protein [uncultured Microbulbifer sp.]